MKMNSRMIWAVILAVSPFLAIMQGSSVHGITVKLLNSTTPADQTIANLMTAYKGEMTAVSKYVAFAKKAHEEGHHEIATLFTAISKSEIIHALNHRRVLVGMEIAIPAIKPEFEVKSTKENLQNAIAGERYEAYSMYPDFIMTANKAGNKNALVSFNYACKTEIKHKILYEKSWIDIQIHEENDLPSGYYICQVCGMIYPPDAPSRCNLCLTEKGKFLKVDKF